MNSLVCSTLLLAALVITDVKGMINLYFFVFINSISFSALVISSLTARDGPQESDTEILDIKETGK